MYSASCHLKTVFPSEMKAMSGLEEECHDLAYILQGSLLLYVEPDFEEEKTVWL